MSDELKLTLISTAIGVVFGPVTRTLFPNDGKRWAKCSKGGRLVVGTLGTILFGAYAAGAFYWGYVYFGWFCVGFTALGIWGLLATFFKPLTKEQEQRIDASDPTKLKPFRFGK